MRGLLFALQLCLCAVYALPKVTPVATTVGEGNGATVTPAPAPRLELVKRELDDSVCGWIDGNYDTPLKCDISSATCLWDTSLKIVGCGNIETLPSATTCVDYTSSATGTTDPSIQTCSPSKPYCTPALFPSSYTMFACGASPAPSVSMQVALTYASFSTPIPLPRLVVEHSLTAETQLPSAYAQQSQTSSTTSSSRTCSPSAASSTTSECPVTDTNNNASIIAAAVGGGVLLLGLPFGIKMMMRKLKWRTESIPKQRTNPFRRRQPITAAVAGDGFLFSQEWHGRDYGAGGASAAGIGAGAGAVGGSLEKGRVKGKSWFGMGSGNKVIKEPKRNQGPYINT